MAPTPAAAPAWPPGERGTTLLHVDQLFGDLFGVESELQARGRGVIPWQGFTGYWYTKTVVMGSSTRGRCAGAPRYTRPRSAHAHAPHAQAKLHQQRSDANLCESPWAGCRSELPAEQFAWGRSHAVGVAGPSGPGTGKLRKVRLPERGVGEAATTPVER